MFRFFRSSSHGSTTVRNTNFSLKGGENTSSAAEGDYNPLYGDWNYLWNYCASTLSPNAAPSTASSTPRSRVALASQATPEKQQSQCHDADCRSNISEVENIRLVPAPTVTTSGNNTVADNRSDHGNKSKFVARSGSQSSVHSVSQNEPASVGNGTNSVQLNYSWCHTSTNTTITTTTTTTANGIIYHVDQKRCSKYNRKEKRNSVANVTSLLAGDSFPKLQHHSSSVDVNKTRDAKHVTSSLVTSSSIPASNSPLNREKVERRLYERKSTGRERPLSCIAADTSTLYQNSNDPKSIYSGCDPVSNLSNSNSNPYSEPSSEAYLSSSKLLRRRRSASPVLKTRRNSLR